MTTSERLTTLALRPCSRELRDLEPLRNHPSPGVQNRVGNRLRAVARRRPDLVAATCSRWLAESPSPATRRIVPRAMRGGGGGTPA